MAAHEMRVEIAPRLAHGLRAAGHRHRLEAAEPLEAAIIGEQELAAPQGAVIAEAEPVERDAEDGGCIERLAVLGQAAATWA